MSTHTPPSGPAAGDPSARPTAVVGQVPEADRTTAVGGIPAPMAYPPGYQPGYPPGQAPYGQAPYGAPGYGPPPPRPTGRGWIGWLVGGIAVVLVGGVVAAYLLLSGGGTLIGVSATSVPIPDASPSGVTGTVALDGSGTVEGVHVEASITHPYTCDLTVRLISPQGTQVTVADPQDCSRSAPNLAVDLDSSTPGSPLAPLVGQEARGEWRLQVVDAVGVDQGTLTGWGLTVETG